MKKLVITLSLLIPTLLQARSYDMEEPDFTGVYIIAAIAIAIQLLITWGIINHATRADRLVKINLMQLQVLRKLYKKQTGEDISVEELTTDLEILNYKIQKKKLDISNVAEAESKAV